MNKYEKMKRKVQMLISAGMTNGQIRGRMVQDHGPNSITEPKPESVETLMGLFDDEMIQCIRRGHRLEGRASKYDRE